MAYAPISEIIEDLKQGKMIILVDDEERENEGDLVCAAEFTTPEIVNFMVTEGRGMLCVAMTNDDCDRLDLPHQAAQNTAQRATAFTTSVDATSLHGITTGVSATDRAKTIQLLSHPDALKRDFDRPGHVHPLRARDGGVLVRTGQTEGSVDLCKLAGLRPAASIIEMMNDDGSMARRPELEAFSEKFDLKMCTVADLIAYRLESEVLVERVQEQAFTTADGEFTLISYKSQVDALQHVALVKGRVGRGEVIEEPVLVRMHSQNILGDIFGDVNHPTGNTLHEAMKMVQASGEGAIVYMRSEGMGSGLSRELQELQHQQYHPDDPQYQMKKKEMKRRFDFGIGSQILNDLGIRHIKLITNHTQRFHSIDGFGLTISEIVPTEKSE